MFRNLIRNTKYATRVLCCVFFFWLAACAPAATATPFIAPSSRQAQPTAAIDIEFWTATPQPATAAPDTAIPQISPTPPAASPTPPCAASLRFLEDITIPDGTIVSPGQNVEKQWRVENNGSCHWDARYRLKLIDGFPLGLPAELALYPARAGTTATLALTFTAPLEPGTYRTAWQAFTPEGQPFGDAVFMEIIVQ